MPVLAAHGRERDPPYPAGSTCGSCIASAQTAGRLTANSRSDPLENERIVHPESIDIKIVRALRAEGWLINVELATTVNVSRATCYRRTQPLLAEGNVGGVRAEIAPAAAGLGVRR